MPKNITACILGAKESVKPVVEARLKGFKAQGKKGIDDIFKELCFCILTANFTAERGMKIQAAIGDGFLRYSEDRLAKELKSLGHRFPNARAKYIVEAREHIPALEKNLALDTKELRAWIADNVKGLGMKESSHFLRNIGHTDVAIIDFHVIDFLVEQKAIKRPKSINRRNYLEIESVLDKVCRKLGMNQAELDLYMWYCETGKVLK